MDNVGFITAAYLATFIVVGGYTLSLWRRLRRARQNQSEDAT
jgi:CcmD family protein